MTPPTVTFEGSFYIGIVVGSIIYGVQFSMFCLSTYLRWKFPRQTKREQNFYLAYSAALLVLITLAMASNAVYGQLMWIEHRDYPGGPAAYFSDNTAIWFQTLGSAADVTGNIFGEALMLYRCYLIFGSKPRIVLVPALMFLASTAIAIITVVESGLPNSSFFRGTTIKFGIVWVALTVSFSVVVTIMISIRLLIARRRLRLVCDPKLSDVYTSVIAILVESAAPFSILGIVFVVLYSKNNPVEFFFSSVWGTFCTLSPQLIILRVSMGAAWSAETVSQISTPIAFANSASTIVALQPYTTHVRNPGTDAKGSSNSVPSPLAV